MQKHRFYLVHVQLLTHSISFLDYTNSVIDAPYILFYSARGCSAREMHAIAIKLAWTIVAALCSRDMGSVYLEKEQKNHTATRII